MPLKTQFKTGWKYGRVLLKVGIEVSPIGLHIIYQVWIGLVKKIRMVAFPRWLAVGFRGLTFGLGFCVSSLMEIRVELLVLNTQMYS